jgi:hypothetical protein
MSVCLFVFKGGYVSVSSPVLFFALFGREGGGGCDPDGPRTRDTSCAIPSWNVPKSIFGKGKTGKVSPKIVSPNKEAVFFDQYFFLKMEYT